MGDEDVSQLLYKAVGAVANQIKETRTLLKSCNEHTNEVSSTAEQAALSLGQKLEDVKTDLQKSNGVLLKQKEEHDSLHKEVFARFSAQEATTAAAIDQAAAGVRLLQKAQDTTSSALQALRSELRDEMRELLRQQAESHAVSLNRLCDTHSHETSKLHSSIDELSHKTVRLDDEVQRLNRELAESRNANERQAKLIAELKSEIAQEHKVGVENALQTQSFMQELSRVQGQVTQQDSRHVQELKDLKQSLRGLRDTIAQVSQSTETKLQDLAARAHAAQGRESITSDKIAKLSAALATLEGHSSASGSQQEETTNRINKLEYSLKEQTEMGEKRILTLKSFSDEFGHTKQTLSLFVDRLTKVEGSITVVMGELRKANGIAIERAEEAKSSVDRLDENLQQMTRRVKKIEQHTVVLSEDAHGKSSRLTEIEKIQARQKEELTQVAARVEAEQEERRTLRNEVALAKETKEVLSKENQSRLQQVEIGVTTNVQQLKELDNRYEGRAGRLQSGVDRLRQDHSELKNKLLALEKQCTEEKNTSSKVARIETELQRLERHDQEKSNRLGYLERNVLLAADGECLTVPDLRGLAKREIDGIAKSKGRTAAYMAAVDGLSDEELFNSFGISDRKISNSVNLDSDIHKSLDFGVDFGVDFEVDFSKKHGNVTQNESCDFCDLPSCKKLLDMSRQFSPATSASNSPESESY